MEARADKPESRSKQDRKAGGSGASSQAAARRYFDKFERIVGYLQSLAETHFRNSAGSAVIKGEADSISGYLGSLSNTFAALSTKYLMSELVTSGARAALEIDRSDSGFPVHREVLQMASDLSQADRHLVNLPGREQIKSEIVTHILREHTIPRRLQYALSQRIYYENLKQQQLFLTQNDPVLSWLGNTGPSRRRFLIHWAVYDSQRNLPNIYAMVVEDSGGRPLHRDDERWPLVQQHLMAQSLSSLKLLTIARGFDKDFPDIHPKSLKRIHVGPMYSSSFTTQRDDIQKLLDEADGEPGQDWLLVWTTESLHSKETKDIRSGLFGSVSQEVFALDHTDAAAFEAGASRIEPSIILPYRPFQALLAGRAPSLKRYKRYVVSPDGTVLAGA